TVLISPDGVLAQFPFAALPGSKPGSYLVEELSIGYVASGHQLVELARQAKPSRRKASGLLALGGIDYGAGKKYDPLPGTDTETLLCRDLFLKTFPKERADHLGGRQATAEKVLKASDDGYRFLHLATHAWFESTNQADERLKARKREPLSSKQEWVLVFDQPFLRSGLALAGANQPSAGVLLAEEVKSLDLRGCELVVLSDCQTAV